MKKVVIILISFLFLFISCEPEEDGQEKVWKTSSKKFHIKRSNGSLGLADTPIELEYERGNLTVVQLEALNNLVVADKSEYKCFDGSAYYSLTITDDDGSEDEYHDTENACDPKAGKFIKGALLEAVINLSEVQTTDDKVWKETSEKIALSRDNGFAGGREFEIELMASELSEEQITILQKLTISEEPECWEDADVYTLKITDRDGTVGHYYDDNNACGDESKLFVDPEILSEFIEATDLEQ